MKVQHSTAALQRMEGTISDIQRITPIFRVILNNEDCVVTNLPPPPEVHLAEEQQKVLDVALAGKSMFFTGNFQ